MTTLFAELNWTLSSVIVIVLGTFITHAMGIVARAHQKDVVRTPFSWSVYRGDPVNWLSMAVTVAVSLFLLAVRDGFVSSLGLRIDDPAHFAILYSGFVSVMGQLMWERFLKLGAAAFNSNTPPQP